MQLTDSRLELSRLYFGSGERPQTEVRGGMLNGTHNTGALLSFYVMVILIVS